MDLAPGARYVALGSSFAAGPGLMPRAAGSPRPSGRSAGNYPHLLAARLGLDLHDVTFSGATTADILGSSGEDRTAQVSAVDSATSLVTLTGGGNDVGYLTGLTLSRLPRLFRSGAGARRQLAEALDPTTLDTRFAALEARLSELVGRIRQRAPEAVVVLVDYLTILPPADGAAAFLPALSPSERGVLPWGRDVADRLTHAMQAAAIEHGALFAPVGVASAGHHAWSTEPWTGRFHFGLRGGAPYHPTSAGMRGVAELLVELVGQR